MGTRSRSKGRLVWRLTLIVVVTTALLALLAALLPQGDPDSTRVMLIRIAAGFGLSALTVGLVIFASRVLDRKMGVNPGLHWSRESAPQVLMGAALWIAPATATFGIFALFGARLSVNVGVGELVIHVALLALAVLLSEAIPEEAVFRGYVLGALLRLQPRWWAIIIQAVIFTLIALLLRQDWNPLDLSLFFTMGVGFAYLRVLTGAVWLSIGFHTAFQTGAQLILSHDVVSFAGTPTLAMLGIGAIPFTIAAIIVSVLPAPSNREPLH